MAKNICGQRYGKRRELTCRRNPNHTGAHALRKTVQEVMQSIKARRKP